MAERTSAAQKATTGAGTTRTPTGQSGKSAQSGKRPDTSAARKSAAVGKGERTITKSTQAKSTRTTADAAQVRAALEERLAELRAEYEQTVADIADLQRDRLTDSAGDDQADTGTKTFEREQEISLANGILERVNQVERALERLDEGNYGMCERCGNPIPVERLAAFPSATLCVGCKQLEERR